MADNIFEILIKFGLSKEKANEAVAELKKVEKAGVEAEKSVEEATNKTFASKKQLKDVLKQIGHEFPILGQVGRLALNPIAFSAAAITSAFVLAKKSFDNIEQSFRGFDGSGNKILDISEVNKLTAAYEKMSTAVGGLGTNLERLKTRLSENEEVISTNAKFLRGLGLDLGTGPEELNQALKGDAALRLYQSGRAKVAAGSRLSPEALEKLKTESDAAEKQMETQKERRAFLADVKSGKRSAAAFAWRYGLDSVMSDAEAAESATEGQAQAAIGRYRTARSRVALRAEGLGELKESESLARSNLSARRSTFAESSAPLTEAATKLQNSDLLALPQAIAGLIRAWDESVRLMEKAQQEAKVVNARFNNSAQRP